MKNIVALIVFFLGSFSLLSAQTDDEIILTIGNNKYSTEEFVRIYEKNNNNLFDNSEKKTPKEYMELFINYKLKVLEAERLKMDTAKAFIDELSGYRDELAAPYLADITYNAEMVEETYQRMKTEVKASHILVSLNKDATDTLAAYRKAIKIRDEILNGKKFEDAAIEYSNDPSVKINKGNLGYFSAFQMVYPFENAAFTTPVGDISMPVRTMFGYHLIKVVDKRPAKGKIKVAHIMKMFPKNASEEMKANLKRQIDSLYTLLKQGADFGELAKTNSDDKRSSIQGGELPWFNSSRMIPEFAEQAFALKKNGDISKPVLTPFGYHIIKRIDYREVPSFEKAKKEIEGRIKKDPERSQYNQKMFINRFKKEYNFKIFDANLDACLAYLEDTYKEGLKSPETTKKDSILNKALFELDNLQFNANVFEQYIKGQTVNKEAKGLHSELMKHFEAWVDKEVIDYEDRILEQKYPEFRYLMQEYYDGILLFNLSDSKIWTFATRDSVGLRDYYEKHKGKYSWGERFKGYIIKCKDQETKDEVDKFFAAGIPVNEILSEINKVDKRVSIEEGAWEKNSNSIVDYFVWDGKKPKDFKEGLEFIRGDKIGPEPKTLEDARGLYISDYQNFLEEKWVKELRKKYKIKVNKKVLKTITSV